MADVDSPSASATSPFVTVERLRERISGAVLAQTGFNHPGLNAHLRARLGSTDVGAGALVAEPVIEGAAAYAAADERLADLSGTLLSAEVINALTAGKVGDDYRFDPAMRPYLHQLESWRHLTASDPRSVLVTSGTGSGKTECFLVPLLDDLAREAAKADQRLSGVRAILLYPLNALIASQQERLRRWTVPFAGRIRFGLYNGMTPEELRGHDRQAEALRHPEQAIDRKTLRADPPPILVTNVTMLEYLTIRREDRPLVRNSQGKLRWIIIDEAHSYVGSAAAEIALLLRRVLHTFGVKPADVRFVATSATIGGSGDQAHRALQRFLADLAGVDESQVYVVEGRRALIELPAQAPDSDCADPTDATELARNRHVQAFVRAAEAGPVSLTEACRLLRPAGSDPVALIEAVADDRVGDALLPLRVHQFMRAIPGLWSCLNSDCTGERPADWLFGALAFERAENCGHCRGPLFEVSSCRDCGEPFLEMYDQGARLTPRAIPPDIDEFAAASERESESSDGADEGEEIAAPQMPSGPGHRRLVATQHIEGMASVAVDPTTGALPEKRDAGRPVTITQLLWSGDCPACHAAARDDEESTIRPFRFGAPFLIGNAAPVMLDGVAPMDQSEGLLPADGRRLLSFTDSRQGTARFAASIETSAERAYVRAYVYHLVQKSAGSDPERASELDKQRRDVEALEAAAKSSPGIESYARDQRAAYEREISGAAAGVPWNEVRLKLSQDPMIHNWIRAVWDRDPRFKSDPLGFANFLLLRELARRPRRANALETLGLAKLRFNRIDGLAAAALPEPLRRLGRSIGEWRDFLYLVIDMPVRSYFALDVSYDDVRWLLPRGGVRRNLVGPGETKRSRSDLAWPQARPGAARSNPVIWLERRLGLDPGSAEDRAQINEILDGAWEALRSLFDSGGSEYSLDLSKAVIAPVTDCWACPVTRRVLPRLLFGRSPYGHREGSTFADREPEALRFPALPLSFPRSGAEKVVYADWLRTNPHVAELRAKGMWRDLHDRAASFAPYLRAEEHSAQQPPERLRAFEAEFRRGEINMLACSTTMEMGVDIGSVSAVLMTNVPPSIANYRQRVGRAGRRRQGFASSLTLARDTPLDRETFREPAKYLGRELRQPQVTLDAPRIVQRHVNALLLASWLAEAEGQLLKIKTGTFFGFPEGLALDAPEQSPVGDFCTWLSDPSVRTRMSESLRALVRGTALDSSTQLGATAAAMFEGARCDFERQWLALRSEAQAAPSDQARNSLLAQLKRLCREHLLKELANRALLPGHGFPTAVVPFINASRASRTDASRVGAENGEGAALRRYGYPSRNADIAIREYAPGAEVVIDGLVWRSAGVTLNWQRPAGEDAVREIQSLRHFWQCHDCGAADCSRVRVERCLACDSTQIDYRRFLEPAGFCVDWEAPSHADTDQITFIPPEPPRISARGRDWEPLLDPALGRGRVSAEGLVFFASAGAGRRGYRICLECGRAEEERGDGLNPLAEHTPLRGSRPGDDRLCPGGMRAFAVTEPIVLGHEVLTDVAEIQPAQFSDLGGAWALVSALREALARRLGIQPSELGMGVEARGGALAQPTHSVFLFDRNSGGAGFSTRLLDDLPALLEDTYSILNCAAPGCERGCAACVLSADLFAQQEIIDRRPALVCVEALREGMRAPRADDAAFADARLSRPTADALTRRMARGDRITIFADEGFDLVALGDEPLSTLFTIARQRGCQMRLALRQVVIDSLDPAQRLGLRDAAMRHGFELCTSELSEAPKGVTWLAQLESDQGATAWVTRDDTAVQMTADWGVGQTHPVISGTPAAAATVETMDPAQLLPKATAAVRAIEQDTGRPLSQFGDWFAGLVQEELDRLGLWRPGALAELRYSDRYIRSPLTVAVALHALAGLRDALQSDEADTPLLLTSSPLNQHNRRTPGLIFHDWQRGEDRVEVAQAVAHDLGFDARLDFRGAKHARELQIVYRDGRIAQLYLDQGFGHWQATEAEPFDFFAPAASQARQLVAADLVVGGRGSTYLAIRRLESQ